MSADLTATIARLRALLAEATPGPWGVTPTRHDTFHVVSGLDGLGAVLADDLWSADDASLIAEAVTALPALLDDHDRLRDDLAEAHRCMAITNDLLGDVSRALATAQAAEAHLRTEEATLRGMLDRASEDHGTSTFAIGFRGVGEDRRLIVTGPADREEAMAEMLVRFWSLVEFVAATMTLDAKGAERARAWGHAEGLAEAAERVRDFNEEVRFPIDHGHLDHLANDLDPRSTR